MRPTTRLRRLLARPRLLLAPGAWDLVNLGGGGKTPMLPAARLEALGFRIAIYPGDLQKAAIHTMRAVAAALARDGNTASLADRMVSFDERFEVVGLSRYRMLEERYRAT